MIKNIKVFSLIIALIVNLCVVPKNISYADTISNPIRKVAIKTTALAVAVGSALGITVGNAWDTYSEKFLQPISNYLRRFEEKDGIVGAYVKDGKTYVSKEMIQGVADYMTEHNMYTEIYTDGAEKLYNEFLEADGFMDSESFFMSVPYYSAVKSHYGRSLTEMIEEKAVDYNLIPAYFTRIASNGDITYWVGAYIVHNTASYIKIDNSNDYYKQLYIYGYKEDLTRVGDNSFKGVKYIVKSNGISYDTSSVCNYITSWKDNFRLGLNEITIREPAYIVADKGLSGKDIDTWDAAWAQQVIDVLKDIQINTSISADDISSADESQIIDALPLSLPQYGIDGTTADVAMQNTASIPMSQAKSGEVTLSPSAIDALSEAIAQAISEAGTTTGEQTLTGEISITPPTYGDLGQYKLDLKDVFPFCIPFDLIRLVKCFLAEPQAPYIEFPIMYPTGIYTTDTCNVVIDLSEYNSVAQVVRTLETILFMLGLIKITRAHMIKA